MSDSDEFIFNNAYCERTKRFRSETNMSAEKMADLLGVPADRYRKYETRSPMPVYLIEKFCLIVGCDLEHLILGKPRERERPVLVARSVPAVSDIQEQVDELPIQAQQVAKAVAGTSGARSRMSRPKGTQGN